MTTKTPYTPRIGWNAANARRANTPFADLFKEQPAEIYLAHPVGCDHEVPPEKRRGPSWHDRHCRRLARYRITYCPEAPLTLYKCEDHLRQLQATAGRFIVRVERIAETPEDRSAGRQDVTSAAAPSYPQNGQD